MPRTNATHALEMRRRILDGAHQAMLVGGYRGTTMPAIAAGAGVSVGLLYRYFASKEELYLAVCEAVTEAHLDDLAIELATIRDPAARLASGISFFVHSLVDEDWGAIVIHAWAEVDLNPRLRDMLRRRCDQLRGFAAGFLREAIARGEVAEDLDVDALSLAVAMALDGAIAHQAEYGERFDPEAVTAALTALIGRAVVPDGRLTEATAAIH